MGVLKPPSRSTVETSKRLQGLRKTAVAVQYAESLVMSQILTMVCSLTSTVTQDTVLQPLQDEERQTTAEHHPTPSAHLESDTFPHHFESDEV